MDLEIFNVKVFFRDIFETILWILFIFGTKFYSAILCLRPQFQGHRLKIFILKVFKSSYFPNHMMDFVHIWYDDRYRSKVLFNNSRCQYPWPQGQS